MSRRWRLHLVIATLAVASTVAWLALAQSLHAPRLIVVCDGDKVEYRLPQGGLVVEYNWTHSVEGTFIVEIYNATPKGLILIKTLAQSFGAGHPYSAEELGGRFYVEGGYMVYTGHYNIGKVLEVEGPPEYSNYIKVAGIEVCNHFRYARVEVSS